MAESWKKLKTSNRFSLFIVCSNRNTSALVRDLLSYNSLIELIYFSNIKYPKRLRICPIPHSIILPTLSNLLVRSQHVTLRLGKSQNTRKIILSSIIIYLEGLAFLSVEGHMIFQSLHVEVLNSLHAITCSWI